MACMWALQLGFFFIHVNLFRSDEYFVLILITYFFTVIRNICNCITCAGFALCLSVSTSCENGIFWLYVY